MKRSLYLESKTIMSIDQSAWSKLRSWNAYIVSQRVEPSMIHNKRGLQESIRRSKRSKNISYHLNKLNLLSMKKWTRSKSSNPSSRVRMQRPTGTLTYIADWSIIDSIPPSKCEPSTFGRPELSQMLKDKMTRTMNSAMPRREGSQSQIFCHRLEG